MWDLCNNNLSDNITKKHLNLKVHNYTATYPPPPPLLAASQKVTDDARY